MKTLAPAIIDPSSDPSSDEVSGVRGALLQPDAESPGWFRSDPLEVTLRVGFVAFAEGGDFLRDPILGHDKVRGTETGHVVPLAVHHRHIQLHHVDFDANLGFSRLLGRRSIDGADEDRHKKQEKEKESFCHMPVSPAPAAFIRLRDLDKFCPTRSVY